MSLPTLDEALNAVNKYKANNSSNLPGLDIALAIAQGAKNDPTIQARVNAFRGIQPPEDLRGMPDIAPISPPQLKYSLTDSVREATADFVRNFAPSNMDSEYYKHIAGLSDDDFNKAIDAGQVNWRDIGLKYLPQEVRTDVLNSQIDSEANWGKIVEDTAKYISPNPAAPTKPLDKAADAVIKFIPGLLETIAKYKFTGGPVTALWNAFNSNQDAREQVFKTLREQGTAFPEAYERANSPLWNAADIGVNAGTNALAFGLMGQNLNIGDTLTPIGQRILNILGGASTSGLGGQANSALRDVWSGQDINTDNALNAGLSNALVTGLTGLFNSALDWRNIRDAQQLDRLVKEHAARHNAAITKYGFTPVSPKYTFEDSALQIQNALYNGTISRADTRAMLNEAGYPDDVVVSILQKAVFDPRINGTGGEANFTMPVDLAPNPDTPQIPFTPRLALNPGKPMDEIIRAANIAKYTSGANQWQNNLFKQIYDASQQQANAQSDTSEQNKLEQIGQALTQGNNQATMQQAVNLAKEEQAVKDGGKIQEARQQLADAESLNDVKKVFKGLTIGQIQAGGFAHEPHKGVSKKLQYVKGEAVYNYIAQLANNIKTAIANSPVGQAVSDFDEILSEEYNLASQTIAANAGKDGSSLSHSTLTGGYTPEVRGQILAEALPNAIKRMANKLGMQDLVMSSEKDAVALGREIINRLENSKPGDIQLIQDEPQELKTLSEGGNNTAAGEPQQAQDVTAAAINKAMEEQGVETVKPESNNTAAAQVTDQEKGEQDIQSAALESAKAEQEPELATAVDKGDQKEEVEALTNEISEGQPQEAKQAEQKEPAKLNPQNGDIHTNEQPEDVSKAAVEFAKEEQSEKAQTKIAEQPKGSFDYNGSRIEYTVADDGTNRYVILSDGERVGVFNPAANRINYSDKGKNFSDQDKRKFSKAFKDHYNNALQAVPQKQEDKDESEQEQQAEVKARADEVQGKNKVQKPKIYTLAECKNLLKELYKQYDAQGMIKDARLGEQIRALERVIKETEAQEPTAKSEPKDVEKAALGEVIREQGGESVTETEEPEEREEPKAENKAVDEAALEIVREKQTKKVDESAETNANQPDGAYDYRDNYIEYFATSDKANSYIVTSDGRRVGVFNAANNRFIYSDSGAASDWSQKEKQGFVKNFKGNFNLIKENVVGKVFTKEERDRILGEMPDEKQMTRLDFTVEQTWFLNRGYIYSAYQLGDRENIAVVNGRDIIGLYNKSTGEFTLNKSSLEVSPDFVEKFINRIKETIESKPELLNDNIPQTKQVKALDEAMQEQSEKREEPQERKSEAENVSEAKTDDAKRDKSPSMRLGERVRNILTGLDQHGKLSNQDLIKMAEEEFGGSLAKGTFTMKDVYDAMEMGVNQAIQDLNINVNHNSVEQAKKDLETIDKIMELLPTQQSNTRTVEQNEFQQFSTPPHIAYIANWLANIAKNDTVLEPSAGVGGLAVFAKNTGAKVIMNELSDRRAGLLEDMNLGQVFRENAEHIHDILPDDIKPTRIVMNPPFSSTAGRISGQRKTSNSYAHIEQALLRLEDGGRLVAILGKGMNDDAPAHREFWNRIKSKYTMRANLVLDGQEYAKYGTTFGNVIVVIDKIGATKKPYFLSLNYKTVKDMLFSDTMLDLRNTARPTAYGDIHSFECKMSYGKGGHVEYFKTTEGAKKYTVLLNGQHIGEFTPDRNGLNFRYDNNNIPGGWIKQNQEWFVRDLEEHYNNEQKAEVKQETTEAPKSKSGRESGIIIAHIGKEGSRVVGYVGMDGKEIETDESETKSKAKGETKTDTASLQEKESELIFTSEFPNGVSFMGFAKTADGGKTYKISGIGGDIGVYDRNSRKFTWTAKNLAESDYQEKMSKNIENSINKLLNGSDESETQPDVKDVKQDTAEVSKSEQTEQPKEAEQETEVKDEQPVKSTTSIKTENKTANERQEERKSNSSYDTNYIYDDYRPSKLKIKNSKHHPADLVESGAMASIEMPDVTYTPHLDSKVITKGLLSDAQLEAVVYAGQAFNVINEDGARRGFFIGDGTGLGKGREIAGIITDQMNQGHGKGKAVWVSATPNLIADAQRDWEGIGNNPDDIFAQAKTKTNDAIPNKKGILFTAYSTIRKAERLKQLIDYLGKDFDGVIAFDEAHKANNAIASQGSRGVKKASQQGLAVNDLTAAFPKARILYVSATGATEVKNLAMLDRLGLWGEGTQFANKQEFVAEIDKGGKSAMEVVARDLKAMGLYVSRSISKRAGAYGGKENVTFSRLTHKLTPEQLALYNKIAEGWRIVFQNIEEALELCGATDATKKNALGQALGNFYRYQQQCFNQIITSMQTPAVIEDIKKQLKAGNSVVIQLTNTDESALKNAISGLKEGETFEDLDITPKEQLINFIKTSFPVTLLEEYKDENGNLRTRQVLDANGNPVISKEAVRLRDSLMADINSIRFPQSPLDMIINEFGANKVAEVTGRGQRIIRNEQGELVRETRSKNSSIADANAFNDGRKRILIFSESGGTGFSYHASLNFKNQQKRIHYLLQAGWKADTAVQGLGRSDRSNQAHRAHYVLVETDIPGQKRFISTIARRLEQLGALTTGERKTATQGLFSESDNLESLYAKDAVDKLFSMLKYQRYDDINCLQLMRDMGYGSYLDKGKEDKTPPITQFLNRILVLDVDDQKKLFKHFEELIEANVAEALDRGTFDAGTETIRADKITVKQEQSVYKDDTSGIETKYIELEVSNKCVPNNIDLIEAQGFTRFFQNRDGEIFAAKLTKGSATDMRTGVVKPKYVLKRPNPNYNGTSIALDNKSLYTELSKEEARKLWAEQSADLPEYITETKHMITGALLPIWKSLEGSPKIERVMTEDGRAFLGRIIPDNALRQTLGKLGANYKAETFTPQMMFKQLEKQGASARLSNGWMLKTVRVNGGKRIEVLNANFFNIDTLQRNGAIVEQQYNGSRRVFIPEDNEDLMRMILDTANVVGFNTGNNIALEGEELVNPHIPDSALDTNLYFINPEFRKWMELFHMLKPNSDHPAAPFIETSANKSNYEFEDKAMEDLYQADKNVKPEGFVNKVTKFAHQVIKPFASDFPELEGNDDYIPVKEDLRKLRREMMASTQEIVNRLRYITQDMTPDDYDLFNRTVVLRDYQETKQLNPEAMLPEGFTIESVKKELEKLNKQVQNNKIVSRAIERAEEIEHEITGGLIQAAKEIDWDIEDKFKRQHYFRHTVIEYINAGKSASSDALKAPDNRGYMKQRKGSDKAIITDYIRAMGEVWARMQGDIKITKVLAKIKDKFDISDELKREAFIKNDQKMMVHLAEQLGTADDAKQYVKRELNKTQAAALTRLFNLARENKLPTGGNKEFASVSKLMAERGQIEMFSDTDRKRLNKYLSWLAGLEESDAGRQAARWYFSGVSKKQKAVKNMLNKDYLTFKDLIPDNYDVYDPFSNRLVFSVNTVPEYMMKLAEDSIDQMLHIPLHDITRALILGGHRQEWIIPKAIADTLNKMAKKMPQGILAPFANNATAWWKNYVLLTPAKGRVWKYNLRNFIGDFESILQVNPGALKHLWKSLTELLDVFYYHKEATGLLAEFQKRGGGLTTESIQELRNWEGMKEFEHLINQHGHINVLTLPITAIKYYWDLAGKITNFRETWLRYADFISRVNQIQENYNRYGVMRPNNYGFSKKKEVLAHDDIYDMAFKISNEDLGAYDQVSQGTQYLRKFLFPFASFQELVIKRNLQGLKNIWSGDSWGEFWLSRNAQKLMEKFNKVYGDGSVPPKGPNNNQTSNASDDDGEANFNLLFKSMGSYSKYPVFTMRALLTMAMISPLLLLTHGINRLFRRDADDKLTPDERAQPHITLGTNPWTGEVIYFNRIGSGLEFLDTFGLDSIFLDGHMTLVELFKQITSAPLRKAINTLTPFIKTPIEMATGRSLYPDFRHPRIIRDMGEYLASTVNLDWWYKAATGKPHEQFFDVIGSLAYKQNPPEASYFYIQESKRQFQERVLGKTFDGYVITRRGEALRNFKASIKYGDKEKARKYLTEYVKLGGTQEGLEASARAMHPLAGLNKQEQVQFMKWLTSEERKCVANALKYYVELTAYLGVTPKL